MSERDEERRRELEELTRRADELRARLGELLGEPAHAAPAAPPEEHERRSATPSEGRRGEARGDEPLPRAMTSDDDGG